jgi:hypothetical protein
MEKNTTSCNFLYPAMMDASAPYVRYKPLFVRMKERCMNIIESSNSSVRSVFPKKSVATPHPKKSPPSENIDLNLQPGDWVQVKSLDEIYQTLDEKKKLKGLFFMPEMEKFCGKKFRVFKRAEIIKLEPSGEIRKLKTPSVFLEGAYCTGEERNEWCDRACFHFWREAWLKRVPDKSI